MYVKIVWWMEEDGITAPSGDPNVPPELVVPKQNCIFETKRTEYRKIRVYSKEVFDRWLRNCYCGHIMIGPEIPEEISEIHGMEFLFIQMEDKDEESGWRNFVAPNCMLYIMNDTGKTIDKLVCH